MKKNHSSAIPEIPPWVNLSKYTEHNEKEADIVNKDSFQDYVNKYSNFVKLFTDGSRLVNETVSTVAGLYIEKNKVAVA